MCTRRRYPSSFAEWVVGINFEVALRARNKKKSRRRDVVRVEAMTDDETEEDTVRVTYPRSRRQARASNNVEVVVRDVIPEPVVEEADPKATVKKVHFEEAPINSALKKVCADTSESKSLKTVGQETEDQDSGGQASGALASERQASDSNASTQPSQDSSEADSSETPAEKPKRTKMTKKRVKCSCGVCNSEPHTTCKCKNCVQGRANIRKWAKAEAVRDSAFDSETSVSESDKASDSEKCQQAKHKKMATQKNPETSDAGTDQQTGDSAQSSDASGVPAEKTTPKTSEDSKKQRMQGNESQREKEPENSDEKTPMAKFSEEASGEGENTDADQESNKKMMDNSRGDGVNKPLSEVATAPYPPHPRFIEPMRSEVIQTERVLETAQDPPLNAYFDAANKVLRVYHGSIHDGYSHGFYARPNASRFAPPIGMPQTTEYAWHQGYGQPHSYQPGYRQQPLYASIQPTASPNAS